MPSGVQRHSEWIKGLEAAAERAKLREGLLLPASARYNRAELVEDTAAAPGIRKHLIPDCPYRGIVTDRREVPCCGGKVIQYDLYACSHPSNAGHEAWSIMCVRCVLPKEVPAETAAVA